ARGGAALLQGGGNGAVRMDGLLAAAQNRGVARLETKHGGIRGDVRSALEDDADDADRGPLLLQAQAVGAGPLLEDLSDGVVQGRDFAYALSHGRDPHRIQPE